VTPTKSYVSISSSKNIFKFTFFLTYFLSGGLLCYPKCKPGYKNSACCICQKKGNGIDIAVSDIIETLSKLMGWIEDIPIVGDIIKLVEDAINEGVKVAMDQFGISDLIKKLEKEFHLELPSIKLNLDVFYPKLFQDWHVGIMNPLNYAFGFLTDWMPAIPQLPTIDQCPDLVDIIKTKAESYLKVTVGNAVDTGLEWLKQHAVQLAIYLLMKAINSQRACETTLFGFITELFSRMGSSAIANFIRGKERNEHRHLNAQEEKDFQKEQNEHYQVVKAVGHEKPRLVRLNRDTCRGSKRKPGPGLLEQSADRSLLRATRSETKLVFKLQMALQQTVVFLEGAKPVEDEEVATGTILGYFVQRMDLRLDNGKIFEKAKECIWKVGRAADGNKVVKWGAEDQKVATFEVAFESADSHPADLSISGFYFISVEDAHAAPLFKIEEYGDCPHDQKGIACPDGAGCRLRGNALVQAHVSKTVEADMEKLSDDSHMLDKGSFWTRLGEPSVNDAGFLDEEDIGISVFLDDITEAQETELGNFDEDGAYYAYKQVVVDTVPVTVTFGPNPGGPTIVKPCRDQKGKDLFEGKTIEDNEMTVVLDKVKYGVENALRRLPKVLKLLDLALTENNAGIPPIVKRMFLFCFGVRLESSAGEFQLYNGYDVPEGKAKLRQIKSTYERIYSYLKGTSTQHLLFHQHFFLGDAEALVIQNPGFAPNWGRRKRINFDFFHTSCGETEKGDGKCNEQKHSVYCQEETFQTIVHEVSHAVSLTLDHIYLHDIHIKDSYSPGESFTPEKIEELPFYDLAVHAHGDLVDYKTDTNWQKEFMDFLGQDADYIENDVNDAKQRRIFDAPHEEDELEELVYFGFKDLFDFDSKLFRLPADAPETQWKDRTPFPDKKIESVVDKIDFICENLDVRYTHHNKPDAKPRTLRESFAKTTRGNTILFLFCNKQNDASTNAAKYIASIKRYQFQEEFYFLYGTLSNVLVNNADSYGKFISPIATTAIESKHYLNDTDIDQRRRDLKDFYDYLEGL